MRIGARIEFWGDTAGDRPSGLRWAALAEYGLEAVAVPAVGELVSAESLIGTDHRQLLAGRAFLQVVAVEHYPVVVGGEPSLHSSAAAAEVWATPTAVVVMRSGGRSDDELEQLRTLLWGRGWEIR